MKTSSTLVFFGTEDFSLPSLKSLVESGFHVIAVVTKPDTPRGRSKQLVAPIVKSYAESQGIPVYQPHRLGDIHDELIKLDADAGVLVSYGKILPQRTLDVFDPIGVINVHPSLLPKYRGPAPIEAAIVNGDEMTGISIMRLSAGMDEGPVFAQMTIPLDGNETRPTLTAALANTGATFLTETLPDILENKLEAVPQQNTDVSYTSLLTKDMGILNPITDTAYALECKVRAYLGFPKTRLKIKNTDVIVTSVKVVESLSSAPLVIECANETFLEVRELIAPSGKTMTGDAFLRGYSA
jgi:methionyl-tRNA formyltransferase